MKTARGVNAFIRYWDPQNGGINESSKDEYSALLKVFLAADSLRWFADTYLTVPNIVLLLGQESSELKKLKDEWYLVKVNGCAQDNSRFPQVVWIKKMEFWKEETLQDIVLKTMMENMSMEPTLVP